MAKRNLVNIIGKLFVDEEFREKYFEDSDAALKKATGLTRKEEDFLRDKEAAIRRFVKTLNVKYIGQDKRN